MGSRQLLKFDRELLPSGNCIFLGPLLSTQPQAYTSPPGETAGMAEGNGHPNSNEDSSKALCNGEIFNEKHCSSYAAFTNQYRTAKIESFPTHDLPVLRGGNVYAIGEHDIRIRLHIDGGPYYDHGVLIGMINAIDPNDVSSDCYKPRVTAWNSSFKTCLHPEGDFQSNRDLGQPWRSGDIVHLHLDCEKHTLCARHERTGKIDTIENVVEPQRLVVSIGEKGTMVEIV